MYSFEDELDPRFEFVIEWFSWSTEIEFLQIIRSGSVILLIPWESKLRSWHLKFNPLLTSPLGYLLFLIDCMRIFRESISSLMLCIHKATRMEIWFFGSLSYSLRNTLEDECLYLCNCKQVAYSVVVACLFVYPLFLYYTLLLLVTS